MKNFKILSAILTTALILTLTLASCSSGGGDPTSVVYEGVGNGNTYKLEITKGPGRAAYVPVTGDDYVLTINPVNKTSTGTVTVIGSGSNLTLFLSGGESLTVTISGGKITAMSGTITLTDNSQMPVNFNSDNNNNNVSGWVQKKQIYSYNYNAGDSATREVVYTYRIYRYTSRTTFEYEGTETHTFYDNSNKIIHNKVSSNSSNGQIITVETRESSDAEDTYTATDIIDLASFLPLKRTCIYPYSTSKSYERTYNIQLLSDSDGVKTYKYYTNTYISNNVSQDVSMSGYSEYKIQNGRTLETKGFSADGTLYSTTTYTQSDDPVIREKFGVDWTLVRVDSSNPAQSYYTTIEFVSASATELVLKLQTIQSDGKIITVDMTFEKVNYSF